CTPVAAPMPANTVGRCDSSTVSPCASAGVRAATAKTAAKTNERRRTNRRHPTPAAHLPRLRLRRIKPVSLCLPAQVALYQDFRRPELVGLPRPDQAAPVEDVHEIGQPERKGRVLLHEEDRATLLLVDPLEGLGDRAHQ